MFWLIDSCQNSVSADQYRLAYRGLRYRPTESECFFKVSADKLLPFKWSQAQVQFFFKCIWNKSCSLATLLKFWFRTDLGRENSTGFYISMHWCRKGNCFWLFSLSRVDHALRPIFMFLLVKIWQVSSCGKIYAASGNLLTDSWSWSFVSSCDVWNCLFLLGVQNEIQLLSRLFCNSWLVCLLRFLLTNAPLVEVIGNPR